MQTLIAILVISIAIPLACCRSVPRQVVHGTAFTPRAVDHGVPFNDSDIRAIFFLDGANLRYSVANNSKDLFFVTEDPLNVSGDGKLGADSLSFISGKFSGPSVSAIPRAVLLKPGEEFVIQVNLEKNYQDLNLARSQVPERWQIRTSAFESLSEASDYWSARELTKGGQTTQPRCVVARWHRR